MRDEVLSLQHTLPGTLGEWIVTLRDDAQLEAVPPSCLAGAAMLENGRADHLTALRAERIERNVARRLEWAAEFLTWAKPHGFAGAVETSRHRLTMLVQGPVDRLDQVVAFRLVEEIDPVSEGRPDDWTLGSSETYPCTGEPNRFDPAVDNPRQWQCERGAAPFMDALNQATGQQLYIDDGWTGAGPTAAGGLAAWAVELDTTPAAPFYGPLPHLVVGVNTNELYPGHPAFKKASDGGYRFKWGARGAAVGVDISLFPPEQHAHDMMCAAILMADVTRGQDPAVGSSAAREARSGIARDAFGVFTDGKLGGSAERYANHGVPVDILASSWSQNSGLGTVGNGRLSERDHCPTERQARGVDANSKGVTDAFVYESVLGFKSAGNQHKDHHGCTGGWSGTEHEIGCPGASPAIVAVGALSAEADDDQPTASSLQRATRLEGSSSGGLTADGRAYPSLVVLHWQCGTAQTYTGRDDKYGIMGATSGAAPRVAGGGLALKHWLLDSFGSAIANNPAWLMVNVLNFGDGFADTERGRRGGEVTGVPAVDYGVGRFMPRLFNSRGMNGAFGYGGASRNLAPGERFVLSLGDVPRNQRFVATLWWLEVNTGEGERKAEFVVSLGSADRVDVRTTGEDPVIRFQFDCRSEVYTERWDGELLLVVDTLSVPKEQRVRSRTSRTLYLTWYYETEDWGGELLCPGDVGGCVDVQGTSKLEPSFAPPHKPPPRGRGVPGDLGPWRGMLPPDEYDPLHSGDVPQ